MTAKTVPTQQASIPVVLMLTLHPDEREMEKEREAEMRSLLDTAGRSVVATLVQHVQKPAPGTYIGTGKVTELKELAFATGAQQAVFDVQLHPRQQRNLEEAIECAVLDYDEIILDIFARNARTNQAMLAVELAQAEYTRAASSACGRTLIAKVLAAHPVQVRASRPVPAKNKSRWIVVSSANAFRICVGV